MSRSTTCCPGGSATSSARGGSRWTGRCRGAGRSRPSCSTAAGDVIALALLARRLGVDGRRGALAEAHRRRDGARRGRPRGVVGLAAGSTRAPRPSRASGRRRRTSPGTRSTVWPRRSAPGASPSRSSLAWSRGRFAVAVFLRGDVRVGVDLTRSTRLRHRGRQPRRRDPVVARIRRHVPVARRRVARRSPGSPASRRSPSRSCCTPRGTSRRRSSAAGCSCGGVRDTPRPDQARREEDPPPARSAD